jgi:hypothetical protein
MALQIQFHYSFSAMVIDNRDHLEAAEHVCSFSVSGQCSRDAHGTFYQAGYFISCTSFYR